MIDMTIIKDTINMMISFFLSVKALTFFFLSGLKFTLVYPPVYDMDEASIFIP